MQRFEVDLPFGDGTCTLVGNYLPEEETIGADFEVEKFLVGGVDVSEEMFGMWIPDCTYNPFSSPTKVKSFVDFFVSTNMEEISRKILGE